MIAYQRNQILAAVFGAVALAHVSSTAAVAADPSSADNLRRRKIGENIPGPQHPNLAWWNKIQAKNFNRGGFNISSSFSNDSPCFLGLTIMGLPCGDEVGTDNYDNYVQPTTPEPSAAPTHKPSAALTSSPTSAPVISEPTSSPSKAPVTNEPTALPTPSPTTASPTSSPTGAHSGQPSEAPTTSAPTSSPTMAHSGSPSAAPVSPSPTTLAPTTSSPTPVPTSSPVALDAPFSGIDGDSTAIDGATTSEGEEETTPDSSGVDTTIGDGGDGDSSTSGTETSGPEGETDGGGNGTAGNDASTADGSDGTTGTDARTADGSDGGGVSTGLGSDGGSDTANDGTADETSNGGVAGSTTDEGKDGDLSDGGSGSAGKSLQNLMLQFSCNSCSLSHLISIPVLNKLTDPLGLPVPLTPFGVKITSETPVDLEALSRVTEDFLDEYFKDQLPKLGYPHYNNVALSADEAKRRQRSLRARSLEALEQEITISGNVNFEEEPLPDTELLNNLREAVFAGKTSKEAYLDALRNSDDPGLQSITDITIYEGDSEFIPSLSERTQPGADAGGDDDGTGVRSYVIAAMAALSFVVFGTALFLYNRKQMRDLGGDDKDGLMSEFSEEASDAVLIKDDLGSSDSLDSSHDNITKKLPSIEPEPISLIRDANTLERAMIRSNYNRSLIEKANERVERKASVMPDDDGDDDGSKTISFAETIAKSLSPQSQSSRTKSLMWMLGKAPESNEGEKESSQKGSVDPPAGQMVLVHRQGKNESPSSNLMDDVSLGSPSDYSGTLVARSPSPAPTSYTCTPTIELPPAPISITIEEYSSNRQQSVNALTEGNPSTPFSLVTSWVENISTHNVAPKLSSPDGQSGVEVAIEDYCKSSPSNSTPSPSNNTPSKKRSGLASLLGIAAHPYATVKPAEQEPMSP